MWGGGGGGGRGDEMWRLGDTPLEMAAYFRELMMCGAGRGGQVGFGCVCVWVHRWGLGVYG